MEHRDLILDQFTRQAVPFAQGSTARDEDVLQRILTAARPTAEDTMLDVACGPGTLVCGFAPSVKRAAGVDLTPAMLDEARKLQIERGLQNVSWHQADVTRLPFADGQFSIVTCRFAFHHFPDPLAVLQEMRRVCVPQGRVIVIDTAPEGGKADAFNVMERLRDPSHVRAMSVEEMYELFAEADLPRPQIERFRLHGELEAFLRRSFPVEGGAYQIRQMFDHALIDDFVEVSPYQDEGKTFYSFPVAIYTAFSG